MATGGGVYLGPDEVGTEAGGGAGSCVEGKSLRCFEVTHGGETGAVSP